MNWIESRLALGKIRGGWYKILWIGEKFVREIRSYVEERRTCCSMKFVREKIARFCTPRTRLHASMEKKRKEKNKRKRIGVNYAISIVAIISTKWTIRVFRIFVKWIAATRACCAPLSLNAHSARMPRNNYNFRVRLTRSWLLFFRWTGLVPVTPAMHRETTKIDYFAADVRGNAALKICSEKFANVLSEI